MKKMCCLYFVCGPRYLDDVSLHHLINALCSLSLEAMEMAYGNNKVETICISLLGENRCVGHYNYYHFLALLKMLMMQFNMDLEMTLFICPKLAYKCIYPVFIMPIFFFRSHLCLL